MGRNPNYIVSKDTGKRNRLYKHTRKEGGPYLIRKKAVWHKGEKDKAKMYSKMYSKGPEYTKREY